MGQGSYDGRRALIQSVNMGLYRKQCGKYSCLLDDVWGSPTSALWVQEWERPYIWPITWPEI